MNENVRVRIKPHVFTQKSTLAWMAGNGTCDGWYLQLMLESTFSMGILTSAKAHSRADFLLEGRGEDKSLRNRKTQRQAERVSISPV